MVWFLGTFLNETAVILAHMTVVCTYAVNNKNVPKKSVKIFSRKM